jgi:hypothetical protein
MHQSELCLNCDAKVEQNYCPVCGQKTDTHRITAKHFVMHDLLHGVWHLEKGILFTLKEALLRPGYAALAYIKGKRIRYYNIFYLSLLLIATIFLLSHWQNKLYHSDNSVFESNGERLRAFVSNWSKPLIFTFVPLTAINGWLMFRKLRLNFAEHNIIGGFCLLATLSFLVLYRLINLLPPTWISDTWLSTILLIFPPLFLLQPLRSYRQATKGSYTRLGFFWRALVLYILYFTEAIIIIGTMAYFLSNDHSIHF